jgi:hypothetical protein
VNVITDAAPVGSHKAPAPSAAASCSCTLTSRTEARVSKALFRSAAVASKTIAEVVSPMTFKENDPEHPALHVPVFEHEVLIFENDQVFQQSLKHYYVHSKI